MTASPSVEILDAVQASYTLESKIPGEGVLAALRRRRGLLASALESVHSAEARGQRVLASEKRKVVDAQDALAKFDARIAELEEAERREAAAAETRRLSGDGGPQSGSWQTSSQTYHRGASSPSFFMDLMNAQRGDADAADRLRRNNAEVGLERRALGNTGAVGGSGGEFAPPLWMVDQWVKLARPGRVLVDRFRKQELPQGVSSINVPRVTSGTTTAIQTTQNTALSQTDMTTSSLSSGIVTIGGKQVVSQQLLDQSGVRFDEVVMEDLAADYARALDLQALAGTGTSGQLRGYLTPASTNVVTWTSGTPTASGFYSQLAKLQGQINATRYMPPDTVVLHPRRWAWFASFTDSTGRPLVVPTSGGFNAMANPGDQTTAMSGHVGSVLGMDVFTDPNIGTTYGAGTNEDTVLMFPSQDLWYYESPLRAEAFRETYADSNAVLLRCYAYSALVPDRYLSSLGRISGTGLVTPVFAS